MPRIATIRLKTHDALSNEPILYLETDAGIARVVAPIDAWHRLEVTGSIEVPDGDLEHPAVQETIRWNF